MFAHNDAAGNALHIGDVVASTDGGRAGVVLFEVLDTTAKKVRLMRVDGAASIGKSTIGNRAAGVSKTMFPDQVVRVVTPAEPSLDENADTLEADLRSLVNTWKRDADEHLMTVGQHMHASLEVLADQAEALLPNR